MLLGVHCPVRPSLLEGLSLAQRLGCQAVQTFGYRRHEFYFDPRISAGERLKLDAEIEAWRQQLLQSPVRCVAVHSRAVAFLAAGNALSRKKALQRFRQELDLAFRLGARYYVFHLGPYDLGMRLQEGLELAAGALEEILDGLPADYPHILLENVPGGGRRMGGSIEELAFIARRMERRSLFGFCLDFAHFWGAGYDLTSLEGARDFLSRLDQAIERRRFAMLHINNSGFERGCRLDNHCHLAEGAIPADVYAFLLRQWDRPDLVGILETPRDRDGADEANLNFLKKI